MIRLVAVSAAALILAGAAFAGTDVKLAPFSGISVHGGGHVVLRHGTVQRVTVIKGDLAKADLHVSGNTLDISPCRTMCWGHIEFEVEIVSPKIDAIEAHGGGAVEAEGQFPKQPVLHVQAHGGGAIDTRAIPAETVNAEAHGGGAIEVQAISAINAQAFGGGAINYTGNPPHVAAQANGGGSISKD
jgi:hypothetical protein